MIDAYPNHDHAIRLVHLLVGPSDRVIPLCVSARRKNLSIDSIIHSTKAGTCAIEASHWVNPHTQAFEVLKIAAGFGDQYQSSTTLTREEYGDIVAVERAPLDETAIDVMTAAIYQARNPGGTLRDRDHEEYQLAAVAALTTLGVI